MIGNGTLHYDHDRDGTLSQVAGCSVSVLLKNTLGEVEGRGGKGREGLPYWLTLIHKDRHNLLWNFYKVKILSGQKDI